MKYIKLYNQYLKENVDITPDILLKSINANKVLMGDILNFNSENFSNIDDLYKNDDFSNKLNKKGLKKNNIEYSKDIETFLNYKFDIKFFLLFNEDDSELDPMPEYIIIQIKKNNTWGSILMYKVKDNIRKFYDTLSSKTIEIKDNDKNYIYKTSNAGNDWMLQNIENKNKKFKSIIDNDEMKTITKKDDIKIDLID